MSASARSFVNLVPGDTAAWFHQRSPSTPDYGFDTAAGRYIVMCFFGTAGDTIGAETIAAVVANRELFDDKRACFFGVSCDPGDETEVRVRDSMPGLRFFWDFDGKISRLYGSIPKDAQASNKNIPVRRFWLVLDPGLRVMAMFPIQGEASHERVFTYLRDLPPPERHAGLVIQAPVLILANVFEPDFCRHLIAQYEQHGGEDSGFMRDMKGKTVQIQDHAYKRRKDYVIEDDELIKQTQARIRRKIVPQILKAHQFNATRMERYIVCCYAAEDGAHFRAHRDNTTKGTAHRRFAVSINLNAEFEGGEVSFPEYGPQSFKPAPGAAVVFSCSLLHAVSKVTRGRRYAFLPFLYDEAAAAVREANNQFLSEEVGAYQPNAAAAAGRSIPDDRQRL
jgi:predicted 2-oxoglutarate/Fe(II)-dependent dioxygenase YbiX/peroxiredoxin